MRKHARRMMRRCALPLPYLELGSRRVHLAGVTDNPDGAWVTQQARNMAWLLQEDESGIRCLLRDNDRKYASAFDAVFAAEGVKVIPLPFQARTVQKPQRSAESAWKPSPPPTP